MWQVLQRRQHRPRGGGCGRGPSAREGTGGGRGGRGGGRGGGGCSGGRGGAQRRGSTPVHPPGRWELRCGAAAGRGSLWEGDATARLKGWQGQGGQGAQGREAPAIGGPARWGGGPRVGGGSSPPPPSHHARPLSLWRPRRCRRRRRWAWGKAAAATDGRGAFRGRASGAGGAQVAVVAPAVVGQEAGNAQRRGHPPHPARRCRRRRQGGGTWGGGGGSGGSSTSPPSPCGPRPSPSAAHRPARAVARRRPRQWWG